MMDFSKHTPEHKKRGKGILYVVSTPLGNLEDITMRALKVLNEADLIAAESVTRTRGLCRHYDIRTKVISYNQHNRKHRTPELLSALRSEKTVAMVTDAGTPGISDPGIDLVSRALDEHIRVSPVPGPSAVSTALSVSGMPGEEFVFLGFFSSRPGKRKKALRQLVNERRTIIFFEAPHRVESMLSDVLEILGDRQMVMLREMTKVFEDVRKGPVSAILGHVSEIDIKGECTFVISGEGAGNAAGLLNEIIFARIKELLKSGTISLKDVAHMVSEEEGLPFRKIYKECLDMKRELERARGDAGDKEI